MPDLTISTFPTCASNLHWQKTTENNHTVTYGKVQGPYVYNWHCSCKGFKFRKTCKHIEEAKAEKCKWGELAWAAEDASEGKELSACPSCKGPIEYVQVGV